MTPEQKAEIDAMTRYELCRLWRFTPIGNPLLQDEAGTYFATRLRELGGFSPEISKSLGWGTTNDSAVAELSTGGYDVD